MVTGIEAQVDNETPVTITNQGIDLTNACIPADVILLIDQSTSMRTNDRENLRIDAAKSVIDALYLNAAIECEDVVTHRIAVIGFSDTTNILLPPTRIFVSDARTTAWEEESYNLKTQLADNSQLTVGRRTSVGQAFLGQDLSALSVLNAWNTNTLGDEDIRRKVIILVTDGVPCTPVASDLHKCGTGNSSDVAWVSHYFDAKGPYGLENWQADGFDTQFGLIRALDQINNNVEIDVFMFGDEGYESFGNAGQHWRTITSAHGGTYIPPSEIHNLSDITAGMNHIIRELLDLNVQTLSQRSKVVQNQGKMEA